MHLRPNLIVRQLAPRYDFGQPHQPPEGWLGELITCCCGHGIRKHSGYICAGDARGCCTCRLSPDAVLDAATAAVRE
jgi:hypothetical protein